MGKDKIIGIALDDLKWATVTQFRYHYNASHPVVIRNMRRNYTDKSESYLKNIDYSKAVAEKEFSKALPRYDENILCT
jgi:hypothetical protein